jgi:ComF family protein
MTEFYQRSDGFKIPLIEKPICQDCSNPLGGTYIRCFWCNNYRLLEGIIQIKAFEYYFEESEKPDHVLSKEIRALKFYNRPDLAKILGECLVYAINHQYPELKSLNCIVSVPKASKERQYDQSQLLAKEVSQQTGIPYYDALSVQGEIKTSYKMNMQERIEQLDGKIATSYLFHQNSVLIIDDICTTGATLRECAKVLRHHEAKEVKGLVLGKKVDNLLLSNAGRKYEE